MTKQETHLLNSFDDLLAAFLKAVEHARRASADPLRPVEVMVPNHDTARWLRLQIAKRDGICANMDFMLPFDWLWRQARRTDPRLKRVLPADPGPLRLTLFGLLRGESATSAHASDVALIRHMAVGGTSDGDAGSRSHPDRAVLAAANRLARVLDGYQNYRPEMLQSWLEADSPGTSQPRIDGHAGWQALLWQLLHELWPHDVEVPDRATLFHRLKAADGGETRLDGLQPMQGRGAPDLPVLVFNCRLLPPPVLQHLRTSPAGVKFFAFTPLAGRARTFRQGGDPQQGASGRASMQDGFQNELLNAWAREEAVRIDQLLDGRHASGPGEPYGVSTGATPGGDAAGRSHLLARIQRAILDDVPLSGLPPDTGAEPADGSIRIHSCHGPLREIETLHATLLDLFERDPTLQPQQVAVVSPDMTAYAPHIHAVFGSRVPGLPMIPYRIAGAAPENPDGPVQAFLSLLDLLRSRAGRDDLLDLLRIGCVRDSQGLDSNGLDRLNSWAIENRIHWGMGPDHRAQVGQPAELIHTWRSLTERCWTGHFWGESADLGPHGSPPFTDPSGQEDVLLFARFSAILQHLDDFRTQSQQVLPIGEWMDRFRDWSHRLISRAPLATLGSDGGRLLKAFEKIASDAGISGTLEHAVDFEAASWLVKDALRRSSNRIASFVGGVQFASLQSLRNLPFRVVCLIGLHQSALPSQRSSMDYDLLEIDPSPFERNHMREERGVFLEYLLSAADVLYCSYPGRSEQDDQRLEPSPVLLEWIRTVRRVTGVKDGNPFEVQESLHGFSSRYFEPTPRSRHRLYAQASLLIRRHRFDSAHLPRLRMPEGWQMPDRIDSSRLLAFLENPSREYVRQRIGARLVEPTDSGTEFDLNGLERYRLSNAIVQWESEGRTRDWQYRRLESTGWIPRHQPGMEVFTKLHRSIRTGLDALEAQLGPFELLSLAVDRQIGGTRITGRHKVLKLSARNGLLVLHPSSLKGRRIMHAWGLSLLFNTTESEPPEVWLATGLMGSSKLELQSFIPSGPSEERLQDLLQRYAKGMNTPLRFFADTAFDWAKRKETAGGGWPDPMDLSEWRTKDFTNGRIKGESIRPDVQCLYGPDAELFPEHDYPIFESMMGPCIAAMGDPTT